MGTLSDFQASLVYGFSRLPLINTRQDRDNPRNALGRSLAGYGILGLGSLYLRYWHTRRTRAGFLFLGCSSRRNACHRSGRRRRAFWIGHPFLRARAGNEFYLAASVWPPHQEVGSRSFKGWDFTDYWTSPDWRPASGRDGSLRIGLHKPAALCHFDACWNSSRDCDSGDSRGCALVALDDRRT